MSAGDPPEFVVNCRRVGAHAAVVVPRGSLDLASAPDLKSALLDLLDHGRRHVVLDLSGVEFIDSTALGVLISFQRQLATRRRMVVAAPSRAVLALLELTGVLPVLDRFPSVEAALAALPEPAPGSARDDDPGPEARPDLPASIGGEEPATGEVEPAGGDVEPAGGDVEPAPSDASLTPDAAMVLGIAATAMPFARSSDEQAARWLRILCCYGDAGSVLTSLGVTDETPDTIAEPADQPRHSARAAGRDPVATVTREAELAAQRRGAAIRPTDLLQAVMDVYGPDFDRVLRQHGVESCEVMRRLDQLGIAS